MITLICTTIQDPSDSEFMLWLYAEFKGLMYATAQKYICSSCTREDIVQDSLTKLIQKVDTLRLMEHCVLASYIVSTIRNTAINQLRTERQEKNYQADLLDGSLPDLPDQAFSIDELLILKEKRTGLSQIWSRLLPVDQVLLEGKYILGYSDAELAAQLGCKASSIRMKLTRARRNALKLLTEQEGANSR